MIDLTLSELLDIINSLKLRSLMNYYFSLYIFTNLASRALKFEIQSKALLNLGHNFVITLILISFFQLTLSLRQEIFPVQDLPTSLIEVAIFFIILLYIIGRWFISADGFLKFFATKSLLQNKRAAEKNIEKHNEVAIAELESNREALESNNPEINFTELLSKQGKVIDYDSVSNTAVQEATILRENWIFLLTDLYLLLFVFFSSSIQNSVTKLALFITLIWFFYPRIMALYGFWTTKRNYKIPVKSIG